jgi:hypothetical protein
LVTNRTTVGALTSARCARRFQPGARIVGLQCPGYLLLGRGENGEVGPQQIGDDRRVHETTISKIA